MKATIELPIPEGYEATGEFREPREGEYFINWRGRVDQQDKSGEEVWGGDSPRVILRKKTRTVIVFVPDESGEWATSVCEPGALLRVIPSDKLTPRYRREEREESY